MKLIIHETDCHGGGAICYNGYTEHYSYDDGYWGDIRQSVEALIKIGFINKDDVIIFDENNSIYEVVQAYYNEGRK